MTLMNGLTKNSAENVELNKTENIEVLLGDAKKIPASAKFDLVIANINKNTLLQDLGTYSSTMPVGATLFLSGFYENDLEDLSVEAKKHGLVFAEHRTKNNWTAAVYQKQ